MIVWTRQLIRVRGISRLIPVGRVRRRGARRRLDWFAAAVAALGGRAA